MHVDALTLAFKGGDATLEGDFLREYHGESPAMERAAVIAGALIVAVFGILDAFLLPTEKYFMWTVRYAVLLPGAVLVLILSTVKGFARYYAATKSAMLLVTGIGCIAMILRATPPANYLYSSGLILIILFGFTVFRLRFIAGTLVAWGTVIAYVVAVTVGGGTPEMILVSNLFFLGSATVIGMLASYSIELHARRDFYLRRRLEQEKETVRRANDELDIRVRERTETLHQAIGEKEVLLKELQHRVKNNLAIISSLLGLEMRRLTDETARQVFLEAQTRISAMAALYDQLYGARDLNDISLGLYLDRLARTILDTYSPSGGRIALETALKDVHLDVKRAVPLGLILNEVLTNAVKYAFPDGKRGTVRVALGESEGQITLEISDDGVGLPAGFDLNAPGSMGFMLVKLLCEQIGASLEVGAANGSRITARFGR
ncbi:MAG TPA: sensor histidine kinase [Bacteroidota bacterium]|nr:sensor histidine kinase [Bacteroidota bacterium]